MYLVSRESALALRSPTWAGIPKCQYETTRVTMGVDWMIRPRIVNYYRYELYDFLDQAPGYQTGTAQGIHGRTVRFVLTLHRTRLQDGIKS